MTKEEPIVTILGGVSGQPGLYLDAVRDPATGAYLRPEPLAGGSFNVPPALLDPAGPGVPIIIIDTGVVTQHPWIKRCLQETVDFTGEGPEDLNGHGTLVTLIALMTDPNAPIISVKALNARGECSPQNLIDALNWSKQKAAGTHTVVNMSCGCYTPSCRGDCAVCLAAAELSDVGAMVFVASGNRAGDTVCPAKLCLFHGPPEHFVIAVGAYDAEKRQVADYSGNVGSGGFLADDRYRWVPVE